MPGPSLVKTTRPCECGDTMRWKHRGLFRTGWRLECICGRSGPWRAHPETKVRTAPSLNTSPHSPPPRPKE